MSSFPIPAIRKRGPVLNGPTALPATTEMLVLDASGNITTQSIPVASFGALTGNPSDNAALSAALNGKLSLTGGTLTGGLSGTTGTFNSMVSGAIFDVPQNGSNISQYQFSSGGVARGALVFNPVRLEVGIRNQNFSSSGEYSLFVDGSGTLGLRNASVYNSSPSFTVTPTGAVAASSNIYAGATADIGFTGRTRLLSPSNGKWQILNNAGTSGVQLDFATNGTMSLRDRTDAGAGGFNCGPLSASTGTFSGKVATPSGDYFNAGLEIGTTGLYGSNALTTRIGGQECSHLTQSVFNFRSSISLGWTGTTAATGAVDASIVRNNTGQLDVRGDSGLRVRNLANSAFADFQCNAATINGNLSATSGTTTFENTNIGNLGPRNSSTGLILSDGFNSDRIRLISTFATISGGFNQLRFADSQEICWASNMATNSADIRVNRASAGQLDIRANSGMRVRNLANSAWGTIQCGNFYANDGVIQSNLYDTVTTDQAGVDLRNVANRSNVNCGIAFRPGPNAHWAAHIQAFNTSTWNTSLGNMLKIRVGKNNNSGTVTPTNLQEVVNIEANSFTVTPETSTGLITFNGIVTSGFQTLVANPSTVDITTGLARMVKNSTSGELRFWANDGGSMKSTLLS